MCGQAFRDARAFGVAARGLRRTLPPRRPIHTVDVAASLEEPPIDNERVLAWLADRYDDRLVVDARRGVHPKALAVGLF